MIVRNEQANLPRCLQSVRGLFDEIIVVDTGSDDRTREIARSLGAQVYDFTWIDDFAADRNQALDRATGDYAFWLDADDVVDRPQRKKIKGLLQSLDSEHPAGYVVRCATGRFKNGAEVLIDHIRLFPIRGDVRWSHRLREQLWPALERSNIPLRFTDILIRHTRYADPALVSRKAERNLRILHKELGERPDEPHVLYYLGTDAIEREDLSAALGFFERGLSIAATDSSRGDFLGWIALVQSRMNDLGAALASCTRALDFLPGDASFWFFKAELHRRRHEPDDAEACWRHIVNLRAAGSAIMADQRRVLHLARRKLALSVAARGDLDAAARLWAEAPADSPDDDSPRKSRSWWSRIRLW
jgi:glycosyltransferase involved in cell wall biosynthesis